MGWYLVIGALAAFGGVCMIWALFGWLLPSGDGGYLIIPGEPGNGELPFVRRYLWLRDLGLLSSSLIVADLGLCPEERAWLEARGIEIRGPEALPDGPGIGAEKIDGSGNGDSPGHHCRGGVSEL